MRNIRTCMILPMLILAMLSSCRKQQVEEAPAEAAASETARTDNTPAPAEKPQVVCTTGMIADIVANVGGDGIEVYAMMGPGVDPHLYQATTNDIQALANAEIIFYNGLHLEAKLGDLLVKLADTRPVVAVTRDIPEEQLLTPAEFEGLHDPHVWMDVELWKIATLTVAEALSALSPDNAQVYEQNLSGYVVLLDEFQDYLVNVAAEIPEEKRVLITAHDAFNYFGKAYGFEVRGLQGISTQAEAGTADVRALAEFIVERKIPAIFVESSVPQRNIEAVQAACSSRGLPVLIGGELFSDAMGDGGTEEGTYIGMIRHNMDTIAEALTNNTVVELAQ